MKSKKNLTRFTYQSAAFEGWRLCLTRRGITFIRYFSDRQFGGAKKSLEAADKSLQQVKKMLEGAKLGVNGKLAPSVVRKVQRYLVAIVPNNVGAVKSDNHKEVGGDSANLGKKPAARKTVSVKTPA